MTVRPSTVPAHAHSNTYMYTDGYVTDSKALSADVRQALWESFDTNTPLCYSSATLSPQGISAGMLRRVPINLNRQAEVRPFVSSFRYGHLVLINVTGCHSKPDQVGSGSRHQHQRGGSCAAAETSLGSKTRALMRITAVLCRRSWSGTTVASPFIGHVPHCPVYRVSQGRQLV